MNSYLPHCLKHPSVELHDDCLYCGAPVCCRECCKEAADENRREAALTAEVLSYDSTIPGDKRIGDVRPIFLAGWNAAIEAAKAALPEETADEGTEFDADIQQACAGWNGCRTETLARLTALSAEEAKDQDEEEHEG